MPKKKKRMNDVVDDLIESVAEILAYRNGVAMGKVPPKGHELYNKEEQLRMLELAKPLIQGSQQAKMLKAQSVSDIFKSLAKGKCTPEEAMSLMKLLEMQSDLEDLDDF